MPNGPTPEQIPEPVGDPVPPKTEPAPKPVPVQDPQATKPGLEPRPGGSSDSKKGKGPARGAPDPNPGFAKGAE
jgi:hypothetical protein